MTLFTKLSSVLLSQCFRQCLANHSIFIHQSSTSFTILLIHTNDLIIVGNNLYIIHSIKTTLHNHFKIKDLRTLNFLGLKVTRYSKGINIWQRKYVLDILSNMCLLGCKPVTTPMSRDTNLLSNEGSLQQDPTSYRRIVGQLIYLLNIRPYISYDVQQLIQRMSNPTNPFTLTFT